MLHAWPERALRIGGGILLMVMMTLTARFAAAQPESTVNSSNDGVKTVVQLKWRHQFQFAGYYAAQARGLYAKEGFDVELREASPGMDITRELVEERVDYAVNSPVALLDHAKGARVVVLAAILQHSPLVVISLSQAGIQVPSGLIGKRVMCLPSSEPEFVSMFIHEGLNLHGIVQITPTWEPSDLLAGKADAMTGYSTDQPFFFRQQGVSVSVLRPLDYGVDFYGDCLYTNEEEIKHHPARVRRFRDATLEGWRYAMAHPDEIIELIVTSYGCKLSREHLQFEASAMRELMLPGYIEIGHMSASRWRHIADTYAQQGLLPQAYPMNGFIYDPETAHPSYILTRWIALGSLALALVLIMGALTLIIFNRRLKHAVQERTGELSQANAKLRDEIKERALAEMALRRERDFSGVVLRTLDALVVVLNVQGHVVLFNRACEACSGYAEEELRSRGFWELLIPEEERSAVRAVFDELRFKAIPSHYENYWLTKSGDKRLIAWSNTILHAPGGGVDYILGTGIDVTERRQAEQALRHIVEGTSAVMGREFFRDLTACFGRALGVRLALLAEIDACIGHAYTLAIWCDNVWMDNFGFDLAGTPYHNLVTAGECRILDEDEAPQRDPLFPLIGVRCYAGAPLMDSDGKMLGFLAILDDKPFSNPDLVHSLLRIFATRASVELSRQRADAERARLFAAIEQAAETIIITDPDGIVLYANPTLHKMSGYSQSDILGRHVDILTSGEDPPEHERQMWATIRAGKEWSGQWINRKKDGTTYREEATIAPVRDASGVITAFVSTQRDISHEYELEMHLRQARKMEAVGQLAGGVAHDFNNLLQGIQGYTDLALSDLPESHPIHADLVEIKKASARAAALIRQLLAFSRRESINPKVINLNEIIADMLKMLVRLLGEDIEVETKFGDDLQSIKADPSQIEQVLLNLCVNARDAMQEGGRLVISTSNMTLDNNNNGRFAGASPGRYVSLVVADTGIGMDPEVCDRIFEPFFSTKEIGKGTGLGLATVYGVVKQNDGYITVDSAPGQGARFEILLPATDTPGEVIQEAINAPPLQPGNETILLAEDDQISRELLLKVLQRAGYRVVIARDGDEAIEAFRARQNEIRLAILDVIMPKKNGRQVADALRELAPRLPVLFCSGYTRNHLSPDFQPDGKTDLLLKPAAPNMLLMKVREMLDRAASE